MPLTSTCLCLLTRNRGDGATEVLLGYKKTGFGTGKIVAPGGHVEQGDAVAEAAAREVKEETGLRVTPGSLAAVARLRFTFPAHPSWDMDVEIFTATDWSGEPAESEEIRPEWFGVDVLPFGQMWDDAPRWLPRVLAGERIRAAFTYAADNETVTAEDITPLEFLMPATGEVHELFGLIASEMVALFGISRAEAVARINAHWQQFEFLGENEIILHEDEYYWALFIYFDGNVPDWSRNADRSGWPTRPAPPRDSNCWTIAE